ncbi:MAG: radical SAM protein, partial [Oscillospiraceae bacterium]|nr:radical SAM protein [Oscillospiraceae bacterium]
MSARESIIPVFVPHLGCPNDCVFCNQRRISGALEPATAEDVKKAIAEAAALPYIGAKRQLAFYGGSFTAIPQCQMLSLLNAEKEALDAGLIHSVRLSTRPDAIDGEILNTLAAHGVETIELGAQSLDDEVPLLSGRGHTAKDVEDASRLIKERGFKLILQMMTGLPGDSDEKSIETARRIIALNP